MFPLAFLILIIFLFYFIVLLGAQKEGGGPNVFMRESLNLVDFFVSNYVTQDVDLSTLEVREYIEIANCLRQREKILKKKSE